MIQLIRHTARPLEHPVLRRMFAARKAVFVDLLGWDVPVIDGRFELDQFDDGDARYLVVTDAAGAHRASARLLPTIRPHLLDTLFPGLCTDGPPTGPAIFEITRFCLDRSLGARNRRTGTRCAGACARRPWLAHGIACYTRSQGSAGPGRFSLSGGAATHSASAGDWWRADHGTRDRDRA